jgi:hypothetical protein
MMGNVFWYLASPLWIDRVVSESGPPAESSRVIANGTFAGADSIHRGQGNATVLQTDHGAIVRFTEFQVTNGPDLKVWLVKHVDPRSAAPLAM